MTTNTQPSVSFDEADTRADDMRASIDEWIEDLIDATDAAIASEQFQDWLDVQRRFYDYSYRNTLLIKRQCPGATRIAGSRAWQTEFDRQVREGERAIWIWAPLITERCPECQTAPSYHEQIDCEYDETPPEEWSEDLVGFRPVTVFDVSQTEGEPLSEPATAAGEAEDLVPTLKAAAEPLDVSLRVVSDDEWPHGEAKGICQWTGPGMGRPHIEVKDGLADADLAVTLVHEYAHAQLYVDASAARPKREVEAAAVASVVGRYFGLDGGGSAFSLAAWADEAPPEIEQRLDRISETAEGIIDAVMGSGLQE